MFYYFVCVRTKRPGIQVSGLFHGTWKPKGTCKYAEKRASVGGVVMPINRSVVIAPYLALFGMVAVVAVVVAAPWKKKTDTVSR